MAGPSAHQTSPASNDPARARQVELILERVDTLPTLSPVAARLLKLGSSDQVDIADVIKIIETDPAMSTRIIGLCRRADRGLGDRVTTVKRAVLMLGLEPVRSVALSVSIYDMMSAEDPAQRDLDAEVSEGGFEPPAFDRKGFWKHSIAVACAAEAIAAAHPAMNVIPEEAFLAGLLHDIGKLAMEFILPRSYAKVIRLAERRLSDAGPIERAVIGLDHHTAGKRVAEHWELPETLQNVVWLHGQPFRTLPKTGDSNLIGIVTVAKAICRHLHLGWPGDFGPPTDPDRLWREVGLGAGGPSSVVTPLHAALADRLKVLGLDDATSPGLLVESLANANRQLSTMNSALHDRARLGQGQARVLECISSFLAGDPHRRTVTDAAALVAASASQLSQGKFAAAVVRPAPDEHWQLVIVGAAGAPTPSRMLPRPRDGSRPEHAVRNLSAGAPVTLAASGWAAWLADHLAGGPDPATLTLWPITLPAADHGPVVCLVCEKDAPALGQAMLAPLVAAWSAALRAASDRAHAKRLGEQLVESSRAVADMQSLLTQQESMARLGEVTAGAAHEMNNPLTVIAGHAQLLTTRLENEKDRAAAVVIARAASDLGKLIESLHLLSTPPMVNRAELELDTLIKRAVTAGRKKSGAFPAILVELAEAPKKVSVDPELFCGAIAELVCNAAEACPHGPVTVRVVRDDLERQLVVTVKDSGPGLSPRAARHAFDPFFSERPSGRGRGLGLTRAKVMTEALGGRLSLDSVPEHGVLASMTVKDWECADDRRAEAPGSRAAA